MPPFLAEYSNTTVILIALIGLILGLAAAYFFWGTYGQRTRALESEIDELEIELESLQAAHRHMKSELAS